MNISIKQAIGVYGELVEAKHNVNGYGGTVAEIYAYRLMPYKPTYDNEVKFNQKDAINAAKSLVDIINLFLENNSETVVLINEMKCKKWLKEVGDGFTHRVHVEVKIKK